MNADQAAAGFAAIGAAARLQVLRILVRAGDAGLPVGELQERSGIAASTLAHHLKVLAEAGVITQERQGRSTLSRANYDILQALAGFILAECCADETAAKEHENG